MAKVWLAKPDAVPGRNVWQCGNPRPPFPSGQTFNRLVSDKLAVNETVIASNAVMGTATIQFSPSSTLPARVINPTNTVATQGNAITIGYWINGAVNAYLLNRITGAQIPLVIGGGAQNTVTFTPTISGDFPIYAFDANGGYVLQPLPFIIQDNPPLPALDPTAAPTISTVQSGNWTDGTTWNTGVPPARDDIAQINPTHSVVVSGRAGLAGRLIIQTGGILTVRGGSGNGSILALSDLDAKPGSSVIIDSTGAAVGQPAILFLRNRPQHANDTAANSPDLQAGYWPAINLDTCTFKVRGPQPTYSASCAGSPLAGDTFIDLQTPVFGWNIGDKIFLPDSRQWKIADFNANRTAGHIVRQLDIGVVRGVSADGLRVFLLNPLKFPHPPAHDMNGVDIDNCRCDVFNLYRQSLVLTSDPTTIATRAHIRCTGRATVDIQNFNFHGTGRTLVGFPGTCVSGSPIVTNIPSTGNMKPGMVVYWNGGPPNGPATILSVDSSTQITLSLNLNLNGPVNFTFGLTSGATQTFNINGRFPWYKDGLIGPNPNTPFQSYVTSDFLNGPQSYEFNGVIMDPMEPDNVGFPINEPQGVGWPNTWENTYYNLSDSITCFNWQGSAFFWKDSASNHNVVNRPAVLVLTGSGTRFGTQDSGHFSGPDNGLHGMGIEICGPFNACRNAIVANVSDFVGITNTTLDVGIALITEPSTIVPIAPFLRALPAFQGADPAVNSHLVNTTDVPFGISGTGTGDCDNNKVYSCGQAFVNWFFNGRAGDTDEPFYGEGTSLIESQITNLRCFGNHGFQVCFPYYGNRVRFLDCLFISEEANLPDGSSPLRCIYYADYKVNRLIFDSCKFRGFQNCLAPSTNGARCDGNDPPRSVTMTNCIIQCQNTLVLGDRWSSGGNVTNVFGPRTTTLDNNTYIPIGHGRPFTIVTLKTGDEGNGTNYDAIDQCFLTRYDPVTQGPGPNSYQLFWLEQADNFVTKRSFSGGGNGAGVWCPEDLLTNHEMHAIYEIPDGTYDMGAGQPGPFWQQPSSSRPASVFYEPPDQFSPQTGSIRHKMGMLNFGMFRRNVWVQLPNDLTPGLTTKGNITPVNTVALAGMVGTGGVTLLQAFQTS